jgi:hypothetical protein
MAEIGREKFDDPFASDAEVAEMVAQFEAYVLPYPRWTHRAHIGVALSYLANYPFEEALGRVRHRIPLFNRTCGDPDGYHETITVLFIRRAAQHLRSVPQPVSLSTAIEEMAAACDMRWPLRYYSPEQLWSAEARADWVEPDLLPLDF